MTITAASGRMRRGMQFPNISDQVTACLISVGRDEAGSPTDLQVVPNRPSDSSVFYPRTNPRAQGSTPPIDYPREVVWVVNDLRAGETIVIEPKAEMFDPFAFRTFSITYPDHLVSSGPIVTGQLPANIERPFHWQYNVTLLGKTAPVILDPTIIIDEDP